MRPLASDPVYLPPAAAASPRPAPAQAALVQTAAPNDTAAPRVVQDLLQAGGGTAGSAEAALPFVKGPNGLERSLAAAGTALKVSAANSPWVRGGLIVGGAAVGGVAARYTGAKVLPLAVLGAGTGSLIDRGLGLARNTDAVAESYRSGRTDISAEEAVAHATAIALSVATVASARPLIRAARPLPQQASLSAAPASEGFRQYQASESLVGRNGGRAWQHSHTRGVPSPQQLAQIKGKAPLTGAAAFMDPKANQQLAGARMEEVVAKIPREAQLRELTPSNTIREGFEYAWVDQRTQMDFRVRFHGPDAGVALHNPKSTAAQGWIARIERNPVGQRQFEQMEYLTLDGRFHKGLELKQLEQQKLALETALKSSAISQPALGQVSVSLSQTPAVGLSVAEAGRAQVQLQSQLRQISEQIEHFHHSTHLAVGALNRAL